MCIICSKILFVETRKNKLNKRNNDAFSVIYGG